MATIEDLKKPFSVECDNDPDVEHPAIDKRFATFEAATQYCEERNSDYRCVWLSELGVYRNDGGKVVEDWMYFWWSDSTEWGQRFGRGEGYPASHPNIVRKYKPIGQIEELA